MNIEQGFLNAGYAVSTEGWLDRQDAKVKEAKEAYLAWIAGLAKEKGVPDFAVQFDNPYKEPAPVLITQEDIQQSDTDIAVYVISRNSGEGADRFCEAGDYLLFPEEKENIETIAKSYAKTIVVLNIGGVMDLTELKAIEGVNAILLMAQLGNIGGDALLDVLSGNISPSGKTTDTWAKNYMDYPSSAKFSHNESVHDELYEDGIYVGYRYFDSFGVEPEYCFGYGLSYTEFEFTDVSAIAAGDQVKVFVKVKNTGNAYAGKEVVQVYYSAPEGSLDKPYQELAAFKKTSLLAPGADETVEISFDVRNMASYSQKDASWILEKGDYIIRVGNSAENTTVAGILTLDAEIAAQTGKNLFPLDIELAEIRPDARELSDRKQASTPADVLRSAIDASAIVAEKMTYQEQRVEYRTDKSEIITMQDVLDGKSTVEELVAQLTIEEMASFCVGTLRSDGGNIVGNASYIVPGAAGDKGVQKHKGKGTTIKHFAVNNQEDNRYFVNAHVSERALREIYLKGFEIAAKESQPLSIMTSYNLLNVTHTANNHDLIQGMARDEWGFEGTVMTDWFTSQDMPMLTGKFNPIYPISASTGCIYAGNDIQMPGCEKNVSDIVEAVTTGNEIDGYKITKADLQYNTANIIRVIAKIS